jgi:hypothetical protein
MMPGTYPAEQFMGTLARKTSTPLAVPCVTLWLPTVVIMLIALVLYLADIGPASPTALPAILVPLDLYVIFGPLIACTLLLCLIGRYNSTRVPRLVARLTLIVFCLEMLGIVGHIIAGG